eukprot:2229991-Amphidinium_carterae.1
MEEIYSSDRRTRVEGNESDGVIRREHFYKTDDRCCVCDDPDLWIKPLVDGTCWFKGCKHRFCDKHGKTVGHYRPANMNI